MKIKIKNSRYYYDDTKLIGSGSFSNVYECYDGKYKYLVKIEKKETDLLEKEYYFHNLFKSKRNYFNFVPKLYGFYQDKYYNYLVIKKLGLSLDKVLKKIKNGFDKFSLNNIAQKTIKNIQFLHDNNVLHQDIKPENIVLSNDYKNIYLIDFGLSKSFISKGEHIPFNNHISPSGTLRYMSKYTNDFIQSSRRDDLISFGYVLLFLENKTLPWANLKVDNRKEKYKEVAKLKNTITPDELCSNSQLNLKSYFKYCYNLKFEEKPNYEYLIKIFKN